MAAKGKALSIVLAIVAIFASSSAFASIPRNTILDEAKSIDFRAIEIADVDASIDNAELLHHAIDGALVTPAPVESLSESRVWVSRLERPLLAEPISPLTHALHRGSAAAWPEIVSDPTVLTPDPLGYQDSSNLYAFAGGDPVNGRDPSGTRVANDRQLLKDASKAGLIVEIGKDGVLIVRQAANFNPFVLAFNLGMLAHEMINDEGVFIEQEADEYAFNQRLPQQSIRNQVRIKTGQRAGATGSWASSSPQLPRSPEVTPYSQQADSLGAGVLSTDALLIQHAESVQQSKTKNKWQYIREWHDKRATEIFGPGAGRRIGTQADGNLRTYDKSYRGYDVEYKSDNFTKAPRADQRIIDLTRQVDKDVVNKGLGLANPYWHFEHDPRVAPEMAPLLRELTDAGIPWGVGPTSQTP